MVLLRKPQTHPSPLHWSPSQFDVTWVEESVASEITVVTILANRVSELKGLGLTGVGVAANWLARLVTPLKKLVHLGWEYYGVQDLTRESGDNIEANKPVELLQEMFQSTSSWPTP
jgi:hypothetical protein